MISIADFFRRFRRSLFFKLWSGIIAILTTGFVFSGFLYFFHLNQSVETRGREYTASSYKLIENALHGFIDQYELIAKNFYTHEKINNFLNLFPVINRVDYSSFMNARSIVAEFDNMLNNSVEMNNILLISLDHGLVSDGVRIIRDNEYIDVDTFNAVINARGANIWSYFYNQQNQRHEVALLKYLNLGKPGGILMLELDESYLYNMINLEEQSKNSVYILDNNGIVISSSQRDAVGRELSEKLNGYIGVTNDSIHSMMINGSQKYVYSGNVKDIFNILLIYDTSHIIQEGKNAIIGQVLLLALILIATIFFIIVFGDVFARRIKLIVGKMKTIQKGDYNINVSINTQDELGYMDKSLYEMARNITELNNKIIDAAQRKNELELKFLQMQIKPHFLYNSLSSIRWLAVLQGDGEVSDLLENLIQFYKISLSKGKDIIPLKDEIELVKSYIAIENLIHKDQILLDVYVCDALAEMNICKMALQPFVENSIHHGKHKGKLLKIWISIEEMNNMVKILIEDDGAGISPEIISALNNFDNEQFKNFGVFNTLSRLKMIYGDAELLVSSNDKGTVIDIIVKKATETVFTNSI